MRRTATAAVWTATLVLCATILSVRGSARAADPQAAPAQTPKTGAALYLDTCAACHGADGKGRDRAAVGFDLAIPDFTDCSFASREPDADWIAVAHSGGPVRGFSRLMPAFGAAVSEEDLTKILGHVRTFCDNPAWPRGELNLPRTFFTEKAYPEDEAVLTTSFGSGTFASALVYEKRFGPRNQIEVKLPIESARGGPSNTWRGGAGDIALGFKRAVSHSLAQGYIVAVAAELVLPTGDEAAGLSKATPVFEPFVSFGKILPRDSFLQAQVGVELPFDRTKAEREAFWRVAGGRTWTQNGPFGRAWSPMVELIAVRELETGVPIKWDIVPQVQITLNTRQHLMINVGLRVPVNQRTGRNPQLLFYFLWDWFDGGLRDGW
jgi:mono/diheme cytochrome c family protein